MQWGPQALIHMRNISTFRSLPTSSTKGDYEKPIGLLHMISINIRNEIIALSAGINILKYGLRD